MPDISAFIELARRELFVSDKPLKSRVMTALALLEKLREDATLDLEHHIGGVRSGIKSQNRYAQDAIRRYDLKGDFGEYGRRSNDLAVWGPKYIEALGQTEFESGSPQWVRLVAKVQDHHAELWKLIYNAEPLRANWSLGTSIAVVEDLMQQASRNGTLPRFIHGLVAAKLERRLGIELEVEPVNQPDRNASRREQDKPADFPIADVAVEITAAGPDDKHLRQAEKIVREWRKEAWLIVPQADVVAWRTSLAERLGEDSHLATVHGVESFVGQNLAEMGGFARITTHTEMRALFEHYNRRWAGPIEAPDIVV